ncbi:hypothetical protein RD055328_03990 [Companilactobacillus sp. RD055328]|uniref:MarR family winged helix-turn-helix transcriptional regulator n=1 Tax=Companilactobacillus sp. RD055328 TaxID=2916634 RepID=UPI001FC89FC0|nr:MarR family transcriptional regulator [Companilactobacillus sp. RD055328]GKQ42476.1 hypothetical protein RD055328_03990 [Companilactobacillus sp. RD055328]
MDSNTDNMKSLDNWFIKQSKMLNKLDKLANEYKISFLQYNVLLHIKQRGSISPTEIAEAIETSKASISRILRVLQKKGLVDRSYGSTQDRRKIMVSITEEAEIIIEKLTKKIAEIQF